MWCTTHFLSVSWEHWRTGWLTWKPSSTSGRSVLQVFFAWAAAKPADTGCDKPPQSPIGSAVGGLDVWGSLRSAVWARDHLSIEVALKRQPALHFNGMRDQERSSASRPFGRKRSSSQKAVASLPVAARRFACAWAHSL